MMSQQGASMLDEENGDGGFYVGGEVEAPRNTVAGPAVTSWKEDVMEDASDDDGWDDQAGWSAVSAADIWAKIEN